MIGDVVVGDMTPGGWFVRVAPATDVRARVYVFPHAGAGPGALAEVAAHLPDGLELWALNLPARQARLAEPPRIDLVPLVAELTADLEGVNRGVDGGMPLPPVFFGYCGGALLAWLVALGYPPAHLVVGSYPAPDVARIPRRMHRLVSEDFWDTLLEQGGVPADLARPDLRGIFEPALRGDFALYAGYHHVPTQPLDVPITVLHGRSDTDLRRGGLLGWRRHTTAGAQLRELDAGHWLVDDASAAVAEVLAELSRAGAAAGGHR